MLPSTKTYNKILKSTRMANGLLYALGGFTIAFILGFIVVAIMRISYPYELEWMEGLSLSHVRRVLMGLPLYAEPSMDFISYVYTPLYFFTSAFFTKLFGLGFTALRVVSFLSTLGIFLLVFMFVRRETGKRLPGIIAVGLLAATYPLTSYWFDLARVDMLFSLLLFSAFYLLRFHRTTLSSIMTVLLLALAFLTKQSTLYLSLPILFYSVIQDWKRGGLILFSFAVLVLGATLISNQMSGGWFSYYVFRLPGLASGFIREQSFADYFVIDLLMPLGLVLVFAVLFIVERFKSHDLQKGLFYGLLLLGMVLGVLPSRVNVGGFPNNNIPVYIALAIILGLAIHRMNENKNWIRITGGSLLILQFGWLVYDPTLNIPTGEDILKTTNYVAMVHNYPGDVFIPDQSYLALVMKKKEFAHFCMMEMVMRFDDGPVRDKLVNEISTAIAQKRFSLIVEDRWWAECNLLVYYQEKPELISPQNSFRVFSGLYLNPTYAFVPKEEK